MRIAVVGVCASGKTTLVNTLRELGVDAHNIAQEHSLVQKLWRKKHPDILVVLDATVETVCRRRGVSWREELLVVQRERLKDARENASLYLQTDLYTKEEVANQVLSFIRRRDYDSYYS